MFWLIELQEKTDHVEVFGQEEKAKIPVRNSVAISTDVRSKIISAIVSTNNNKKLQAMDYNFNFDNLVLYVTLQYNITSSIGGSFFAGDEAEGKGQLLYTLHNAIFYPSRMFDHTAKLIDFIKGFISEPVVLALQTDGRPDHSIKVVSTKNAMEALFTIINLDHLFVLRGTTNVSACNKIERSASPSNSTLEHVSIKRGVMANWVEGLMKSANSMDDVRLTNQKHEKLRVNARRPIERLRVKLLAVAMDKSIGTFLIGATVDSIAFLTNEVPGLIEVDFDISK